MMTKNEFRNRVRPDWPTTLKSILDRALALDGRAVMVFDLDSTLFDNRPRQARILREFGRDHAVQPLLGCDVSHWDSGWDMRAAMRNCGLPEDKVEALYPTAKAYWQDRFFTSEYCVDDVAISGAAAYVSACLRAHATVAYVTGRHEAMRVGTVECLRRGAIAVPQGNVHLIMKPTLQEDDDAFKRVAHEQVRALGTVIAAFDNEPTHANDYRRKFPEATVVHLATDHSGRKVELLDGIVTVPHFDLVAPHI